MTPHSPSDNPGVSSRRNVLRQKAAVAMALALSGALLAVAFLGSVNAATRSNAPSRRDYASFKLIIDRNIFNASRSSRSASGRRTESRRPNRVDTVTLVGTLSYEKGPYAFFDGSNAEYRTVLEPGKTIVGYQIAEITGTGVSLKGEDTTIELRVGMQLRREDGEEWRVTGVDTAAQGVAGSTSEASEPVSTGDAGDESDIIKRLMQQREQELK